MLVLKLNIYNYFGNDHPEGCVKLEKFFKIDKNMTVEDLEKLIDEKTKDVAYSNITYEVIKIQDIQEGD